MVRHVIIWKLKDSLSVEEKEAAKLKAKTELEALKTKINGIVKIKVDIKPLASSNADMILDSAFVSEAALNAYTVHPEHVKAATTYVRPFVETRFCFDFEE